MQGPFRTSSSPAARPPRSRELPARPIAASLQLDEAHAEQIDQSHQRCAALGLSRIASPDHGALPRADLALQRERSLRLHLHAAPVMELLHEQIVNTHSMVALTDASGTILLSIGDDDFLSRASRVALAAGANWSEAAKGTNAVGTALVSERPTLVHADEHFLHANHFLTCSAAPILDPRGQVLGVLDVSGDHRSYHQHTMALVKMSARMIENHWLSDDCRNGLRLHFHSRIEYIGTLMEGILALDGEGRITGANRGALEQLGLSGPALRQQTLQRLFELPLDALIDRFRSPLALPLAVHTAGGRQFHLHARFNGPMWAPLVEVGDVQAKPPVEAMMKAAAEADTAASIDAPMPAAGNALQALCCGDAVFDRLVSRLERVRDTEIPVLLVGEHGSGKLALARAMHQSSPRAAHAFAVLHCAAMAAGEAEAALNQALKQALHGTLFIDEVDALPLTLQVILSQALRSQPRPIVCASRQDLATPMQAGAFREDLLYQLQGLVLQVPPLRQRSDLPALAQRLLDQLAPARSLRIDDAALAMLQQHAWPGNVQELKNVLRTAVALACDDKLITVDHLPDALLAQQQQPSAHHAQQSTGNGESQSPELLQSPQSVQSLQWAGQSSHQSPQEPSEQSLAQSPLQSPLRHQPIKRPDGLGTGSLESLQLAAMRQAVAEARGNISAAARALGISRNTLYRKLQARGAG